MMKHYISLFVLIWVINIAFLEKVTAKTTFKGGVISQSKSLPTKNPIERQDLDFDLNTFDNSHLNKIINIRDAIRFERRIGYGAPLKRVKLHINKTRKQAIDDVISDLKKYEDNIEWPLWTEKAIPTSFMMSFMKLGKFKVLCVFEVS